MGSKWRKAKLALGLNLCVYVPQTLEDSSPSMDVGRRYSDAVLLSPSLSPQSRSSDCHPAMPTTPTPSSSGLRLSKHGTKSSKKTCAICLNTMKPGQGHAIFTAECSHAFHFHCITSNVKHGSQSCPVCRAKWKEIPFQNASRHISSLFHAHEPAVFDDDEVLDHQPESTERSSSTRDIDNNSIGAIEVKTYPEVSAVPRSTSHNNFTVLIHLKAPLTSGRQNSGTKLALLKRAMGFALQAVNSLVSNGGTNIAEGLRKGAKVMLDRKWKNPVSSIILLSDGQDTYTVCSPGGAHSRTDYSLLLPFSIHRNGGTGFQIPVHAFGFAEGVIQDAFAQCIGGLLSVVVQELRVGVECVHPSLQLSSIKAGSYHTSVTPDARTGFIDVGDLYAEEERDFLVNIDIPINGCGDEMSLFKVRCVYRDPITKELVKCGEADEVKIQRPEIARQVVVSMEVDRQRNRLRAAEAMVEARAAAERGDLTSAVAVLESCRRALSETVSARAGDRLCVALGAELKEMQERMANRRIYEASGRAYVLSGLSSHSWQRATARGDSTDSATLLQAYQTPSMVDMLTRSQTMFVSSGAPSPHPPIRPARSFPARPLPR
ncbi:unnamed protein product, partial [Vitis vinifera]